MAIRQKLGIDERFPWSFTGVVLAILFGLVGVYSLLHENRPNLFFEIESQSDVFDLRRPMQDLALSFRGQDVQQQNLNLRIFTVRVSNKGKVDILQNQYDQDRTWGITVTPGQIIEVRLGMSNSSYLASRIEPELTNQHTITLKKVIFERDKYVTLDILVLHHKDSPPKISSFGKIAGLDEIGVVDVSAQGGRPGFWSQVGAGTPLVHFVRLVAYILGLIALGFAIAGIAIVVGKIQKGRRRRRISRAIAASSQEWDDKALEVFKTCYIEDGIDGLSRMQADLKDEKTLHRALARRKDAKVAEEELHPEIVQAFPAGVHAGEINGDRSDVFMTPDGYVVTRDGHFVRFGASRGVQTLAQDGFVKLSAEGTPRSTLRFARRWTSLHAE